MDEIRHCVRSRLVGERAALLRCPSCSIGITFRMLLGPPSLVVCGFRGLLWLQQGGRNRQLASACCLSADRRTRQSVLERNIVQTTSLVEHGWNVMAHAQKPDFFFQGNGRVHLNRRGSQFSRLLAAEVCASAVVMVVMLDTPCSEVEWKTAGYPLHSPVSPSFPLPCVTVCHQVSTELYHGWPSEIISSTLQYIPNDYF